MSVCCGLGYPPLVGMRVIILSPVACPAVPHFPTLCHKRSGFSKKKNVIEHTISVLNFSANFFLKRFSF